jgi:hypothetical protein
MSSASKICLLLAALLLAYCAGCNTAQQRAISSAIQQADTLVIHDTITREMPVYITNTRVRTEYVPVRDTLRLHDTLFVPITIEKRVYKDSLYRAEISGYKPSLDKIEIYQHSHTIKEVQTIFVTERKRWGLGVQVGYGVGVHSGVLYTTPYIGVGVSYNLLRW